MKPQFGLIIGMMILGIQFMSATPSHARYVGETDTVEISVQALLAPVQGFDDNDNVQVVLYGYLPNACYTLNESKVEKLADDKHFRIHQYATRDNQGVCAQDSTLPVHMQMRVPFTQEVNLGSLEMGEYRFESYREDGSIQSRILNVGKAKAPTIDSLPYAAVSNATVADVFLGQQNVDVVISGIFNSTCTELDSDVKLDDQGDVVVVMPTVKVNPDDVCAQVLRPFARTINLGKKAPGNYLIHVRSMNGKAINRVFTVTR